MGFIVSRLLLIGSLGLVLGACSAATDTELVREYNRRYRSRDGRSS